MEVDGPGEPILIARHGKPAVRLVPVTDEVAECEVGFYAGQVKMSDDFEQTPEDFAEYR